MLLRLIIQNFLSFNNEVQFDMFPNPKRTQLRSHIYTDGQAVPLLKQAAIYGPNAVGKSNLVKAMEFIKAFALNKDFIKNIELSKFFYLLKDNTYDAPIYLGVEFEIAGKYFLYEIEVGLKSIQRETLSETFPLENRISVIFERKKNKLSYGEGIITEDTIRNATQKMLEKNPMSSLLSLNNEFPIVQDDRCKQASKWFKSQLEIIGIHSYLPSLIDMLRTNARLMEFARKLVTRLAVGVNNFNMVEDEFEQWAKSHIELANRIPQDLGNSQSLTLNANNNPVLSISIEDGIRKVYQLMFDHIGKNGFVGHLDTSAQSDGTLRALTLLPALFFASQMKKTVIVDEINFCLSPTMVKGIVEFFAETNDTNGQLIFTTHDINLLDEKEILRSDEIWFVDKRDGASFMYTHNDFKEHMTISRYRGYNEGRYGAIRFINLLDSKND